MLTIRTHGNPYERGYQQGTACQTLAIPYFQKTLKQMLQKARVDSLEMLLEQTWPYANQNIYWMEQTNPSCLEECRGLAKGLGLPEKIYFTVCTRSLVYKLECCTTFSVFEDFNQPMIGKTDDVYLEDKGINILEITLPDDGYRHVHFHFAGTIWTTAGMNEKGLVIAMTGIPGSTLEEPGLSSLDALHTILLSCSDVAEAVQWLQKLKLNYGGFSLQLADPSGHVELVEKTSKGMIILPPYKDGWRIHTNHILNQEFAAVHPPPLESLSQNSRARLDNVLDKTCQQNVTESMLKVLLADRSEKGAICQRGEAALYTDYAVLLLPKSRRMIYWDSYPDSTNPVTVELLHLFSS